MTPVLVHVAWKADRAADLLDRLRLADDAPGLARVSAQLARGAGLLAALADTHRGKVVQAGDAEGVLELPADAVPALVAAMRQYHEQAGSTVSAGVGPKLSEAARALRAAALDGGDRLLAYGPEVDARLERAEEEALGKAEGFRTERRADGETSEAFHARVGASMAEHETAADGPRQLCRACVAGHAAHARTKLRVLPFRARCHGCGPGPIAKAEPGTVPQTLEDGFRQVAQARLDEERRQRDRQADAADEARERLGTVLRRLHGSASELRGLGQAAPGAAAALAEVLGAVRDYARTLPPSRKVVPANGTSVPENGDLQSVSEPVAKGVGGAEAGREHVSRPVGTIYGDKVKVQKPDGHQAWREASAGLVMAPDGTPASARHPNPR